MSGLSFVYIYNMSCYSFKYQGFYVSMGTNVETYLDVV